MVMLGVPYAPPPATFDKSAIMISSGQSGPELDKLIEVLKEMDFINEPTPGRYSLHNSELRRLAISGAQ